ncbi:NHLP bacteriocin export ABC transporter permease/ATPase subunit [Kitasatospora sp. NPDC093102]|uniref:NHLP bacteriocin export ABC transporter permease/ATPase subunit n=1 Tax=Kitasatospora sp. NPDC093102 TaxID=3155069 RepID=UPI0034416C60
MTDSQETTDAAVLAAFGETVAQPEVALLGRDRLWLASGGPADLFAVADGGWGRWRFLGRLDPGAALPSCRPGPGHILVLRMEPGVTLHCLDRRRLEAATAPERAALVRAVELGVRQLLDVVRGRVGGGPAAVGQPVAIGAGCSALSAGQEAVAERDLLWIALGGGPVTTGQGRFDAGEVFALPAGDVLRTDADAVLAACSTDELLADGSLWPHLQAAEQRARYLLDQVAAARGEQAQERLLAGRAAGDAALAEARERLRPQLGRGADGATAGDAPAERPEGPEGPEGGDPTADGAAWPEDASEPAAAGTWDEAVAKVAGLVAEAAGISLVQAPSGTDRTLDPVERMALASRVRTRRIRLAGPWWRTDVGPLIGHLSTDGRPVALLWQRGGYRLVDPVSGREERVTKTVAAGFVPAATMFYRPIGDGVTSTLGLVRFGLRGSGADLRRMLVGGATGALLGLVVPVMTGQILGSFIPADEPGMVGLACLGVVLAGLTAAVFGVVENLAVLRAEGRFEAGVQAGVWDRLLRAPAAFFSRYTTGELAASALGVSRIRDVVSGVGVTVSHSLLLGAANLALECFYSLPLTLFSLVTAVGGAGVIGVLTARQLRWQRQQVELGNKLTDRVFQTLRGLPKLRVAAAENFAYRAWADEFARNRELTRKVQRNQNAMTVFGALYVPLATVLLYALVAAGIGGRLSVADFLGFSVAFSLQLSATAQLAGALASLGAVVPLFERLAPILAEPAEVPADRAAVKAPGTLSGRIELRNVFFSYGKDGPPILKDISLGIEPGQFVAVVGPSGCGKSSLLRLLIGFERPTAGSVHYDGEDLSGLDSAAVRRQCGVVLQETRPLRGSILENIRGARQLPLSEVREAVEMAGLSQDIAAMPMGLHTVVSDGGSSLSGGQRQRLMIAKALVGQPRILLFDEATSALDNETQRIVTESTRKLRATRIVVAHRLSTILLADRVIVLDQGRIVQDGAPAVLLADRDGLFHQLARRQLDMD